VVGLALKEPDCRRGSWRIAFADQQQYFVSEASVYRLLKAHDLITSPAFILMKAADRLRSRPTAPTSCGKPTSPICGSSGWGWFYLSTVLDDFSRYILAWKLCTTMTQPMSPRRWVDGPAQFGVGARPGPAPAAAAERQRTILSVLLT